MSPFEIPENIFNNWRKIGEKASLKAKKFENKNKNNFSTKNFNLNISKIVSEEKKKYFKFLEPIATRKSSEIILKIFTKNISELIGGSADLTGSNNTKTTNHNIIKPGKFDGNYIHYGVREHAMCGIMNGLALHSNFIPYGGTFLIFSDYCKPSIRLSALMQQRVIYVMTHDSVGLGEDGPTHQPIEQLSSLRSVPNLNVFRPADSIETFECWELALNSKKTPSVIALTRQKIKPIRKEYSKENKSGYGAYEILRTNEIIDLTIFASGSEVSLAIDVSHKLATQNIYSKVVSVPSQELLERQTKSYKEKILRETKYKISIEAGATDCWKKYIDKDGLCFGIDKFGKSAPYKDIFNYFGLNSENIINKTLQIINK